MYDFYVNLFYTSLFILISFKFSKVFPTFVKDAESGIWVVVVGSLWVSEHFLFSLPNCITLKIKNTTALPSQISDLAML